MMINIEGNPFRSVIGFKDAAGRTHSYLVKEFADQSEHIVIATDDCGYVFAKADMAGAIGNPEAVFTGI